MTCRQTKPELLSEYADGRLGARERAALEGHLDACADCRGQVRWLKSVKSAAGRAPAPRMPADLKAGLLAEARAASGRKRARRWRERWQRLLRPAPLAGLGLAAGFAAAVLVLVARSGSGETVVPVDDMLAAHRAYELTMPLNAETTVTGLAEALAGARQ